MHLLSPPCCFHISWPLRGRTELIFSSPHSTLTLPTITTTHHLLLLTHSPPAGMPAWYDVFDEIQRNWCTIILLADLRWYMHQTLHFQLIIFVSFFHASLITWFHLNLSFQHLQSVIIVSWHLCQTGVMKFLSQAWINFILLMENYMVHRSFGPPEADVYVSMIWETAGCVYCALCSFCLWSAGLWCGMLKWCVLIFEFVCFINHQLFSVVHWDGKLAGRESNAL